MSMTILFIINFYLPEVTNYIYGTKEL